MSLTRLIAIAIATAIAIAKVKKTKKILAFLKNNFKLCSSKSNN